MKKLLLSLAAVAMTATASWADVEKLVFDGENDIAGLKRQTTTSPTDMVKEVTYSQKDIDFKLEVTSGTGKGYALVNAGGATAGIYVSSSVESQITLTVPNGHITAAKLLLSGYALGTLEVTCNGSPISGVADGSLYSFSWSDDNGGETLTMSWPSTFLSRYIHSIELTYTPDLGGKEACGLAFSVASAQGIVGETFTPPTLENPNNLDITWSSSDESVATVAEDGTVTLLAPGKTTITATTEGNDDYAGGNVKYELSVVGAAKNIAELLTNAPANGNTVKVDFPVTVAFCNKSDIFVIGPDEGVAHFKDLTNQGSTSTTSTNAFKVGQVIDGGWIATNETNGGGEIIWNGTFTASDETVEVTYPVVTSVSADDNNRVLTLKDVTFEKMTSPGGDAPYESTGTLPDGTSYNFDNPYGLPSVPGATYDVSFVVAYTPKMSKLRLLVVSYDFNFPETFNITASDGVKVDPEDEMAKEVFKNAAYAFAVTGSSKSETVTLTVDVPEGWDGLIGAIKEMPGVGGMRKAKAFNWESLEDFKAEEDNEGFKEGNVIEIPVDGNYYTGQYYLYKADYIDTANPIQFLAKVDKTLEFPEIFGVKVNGKYDPMNVTQGIDEETNSYAISVSGLSEDETVSVEIEVPEDWDGFYGMSMSDYVPTDVETSKTNVKALAAVSDNESDWMSVEEFEAYPQFSAMKKDQNSFTFKVESDEEAAMLFLYKGDKVYMAQIAVEVNVGKVPTVPESIVVKADSDGITITDGIDEDTDAYYLQITGISENENVTLNFEVPEGWDGFVGGFFDMTGDMSARKARTLNPVEWAPLQNVAEEGMTTGKKFTVAADGETHIGMFMLYKGNQVDVANGFMVTVNVDKAPAFPEEFIVAVSDENITEISQDGDKEEYYINIEGESTKDTLTVTLDVPEGWDGFYSATMEDLTPAEGAFEPIESTWMSVEDLQKIYDGVKKGNSLTFKVGERNQGGLFFLYSGEKVYGTLIQVAVAINKSETPEPEAPAFPETFTYTVDPAPSEDGLVVEVNPMDEVYQVNISGKASVAKVTITFEVPEGWDGFIGMTDSEQDPEVGPIEPLMIKQKAPAEAEWVPVDEMLEFGMTKRNSLSFNVNGEEQFGQLYLYKGEMADQANLISVEFSVEGIESGINSIEAADSDARYFNLQGVEVKNPEAGVYVKVANGKVSKVTVK